MPIEQEKAIAGLRELLGVYFLRDAPEGAIELDRLPVVAYGEDWRAGKWEAWLEVD